MAKKEQRILGAMVCKVCKSQNYITTKNKLNQQEKIVLKKKDLLEEKNKVVVLKQN